MDINLPLILMVAVAFTGLVWLLDAIFLASKRKESISKVELNYATLTEEQRLLDASYVSAIGAAKKEPLVVEYSKSFFPILAIVFVLRSFLIEPFKIPSESMVPTLEVGDFIAVNKFSYGIRLPVFRKKIIDIGDLERGDVVVFFPPHEDRYFIKRLIGLPGDRIAIKDNVLYLNGEPVQQKVIATDGPGRSGSYCWNGVYQIANESIDGSDHLVRNCSSAAVRSYDREWTVPDGHYFMMGDNRDNSLDSRAWDQPFVPDRNIVGKAFAIWMHWDQGLPSFGRAGAIK